VGICAKGFSVISLLFRQRNSFSKNSVILDLVVGIILLKLRFEEQNNHVGQNQEVREEKANHGQDSQIHNNFYCIDQLDTFPNPR
jgi:hypothetical protein